MTADFSGLVFTPADILLPRECDYQKWAVVACDQYTSQPEYWQRVSDFVGGAPSTLRLILPESCLDGPSVETDIVEVNNTMTHYLREDRFRTLEGAMVYVERGLSNGRTRRGLIGKVDLEAYDYEPGSSAPVRATEGVVLSRIPPRVAVRKNAPLELPHAMLLMDDPEDRLMGFLAGRTGEMELLYDFDLMEGGGRIRGWRLGEAELAETARLLRAITAPETFRARYGGEDDIALAVGDGNHSLATAKECYERQKRHLPPEQWDHILSRYALVELTSLQDESLEFEPVHRVLFGVEPSEVLAALARYYPGAHYGEGEGHVLRYVHAGGEGCVTVPHPASELEAGTLQPFLDDYVQHAGGRIDYIHGTEVARRLAARPGDLAFLMPALDKTRLLPAVLHDGALPRKTFSMGEAQDKRFYLEARKIR
ncbi:DUF1015 domain-containing protein [Pseudoflavonifractor sp. MSJ-37]|uniref:DUF1015 domain-containing protein n=1 Tax=Pseudoflavonifractor sp. MSJ-37 TaxID=2841531 RepID=UPI001C12367A|nr:DUF1015 domain-containing protein [Pseudoflavonifractor sp. MSJ-37]MBU5435750.1 DUF1015 domain-containing protein [Pseudoflavonifractor sp. MSJ-37]